MIAWLVALALGVCRWAFTCWETRDVLLHGRLPPAEAIARYQAKLREEYFEPLSGISSVARGAQPQMLELPPEEERTDDEPLITIDNGQLVCGFCAFGTTDRLALAPCGWCGARPRVIAGSSLVLWERASS